MEVKVKSEHRRAPHLDSRQQREGRAGRPGLCNNTNPPHSRMQATIPLPYVPCPPADNNATKPAAKWSIRPQIHDLPISARY